MAKTTKPKSRKWLILLGVLILLATGGFGYYYWNQTTTASAATAVATAALKTSTVRQGSITISASGSGTLAAAQTSSLGFTTGGTVAAVHVALGDVVKAGQALAEMSDLDSLRSAVTTAQQEVTTAQQNLDTLTSDAPAALGNAQLAVATAQKAVTNAKSGYIVPGQARCAQATTDAYYSTYMRLKKQLDDLGTSYNQQEYLTTIVPAQINVNKAYQAYLSCAGFTSYETDASHATLAVAEAQLKSAQDKLTRLQANNGIDPTEKLAAESKVAAAKLGLEQANSNLSGSTLVAPFDGTITAVNAASGDTVAENATIVTIADLANPVINFNVDETDLEKVAIGEEATVTFDAITGRTFTGKVTRINPTLVTVSGYQTVQGTITLDLSKEKDVPAFPSGLSASVVVYKARADNALIVPAQAVRDLGNGSYAVFVVSSSGKLQMKTVEVGLMDTTNVEIKSGLKAGEIVSTGDATTK